MCTPSPLFFQKQSCIWKFKTVLRAFIIVFLVAGCPGFSLAESGTTVPSGSRIRVRGLPHNVIWGNPPEKLRLNIRTPLGLQRLRLWKQNSQELQVANEQQVFYVGNTLNQPSRLVSASLSEDEFTVFGMSRRGRPFFLRKPQNSRKQDIHISHAYSKFSWGCDTEAVFEFNSGDRIYQRNTNADQQLFFQLSLAAAADKEWIDNYGGALPALRRVEQIVHATSAIYLSQLGVSLDLSEFSSPSLSSSEVFPARAAIALLEQFSLNLPFQSPFDTAHLFSGKRLTGNTLGLAYIGGACKQNRYRVSVSAARNEALQQLVLAHEVAHTLGASHDDQGRSGNSENSGYLMNSVVSVSKTRFSPLSIKEIGDYLLTHPQCLDSTSVSLTPINVPTLGKLSDDFAIDYNTGYFPPTCQLEIHASNRKRKLNNRKLSRRRRKRTLIFLADSPQTIQLTANTSFSRRKPGLWLRAALQCPGRRPLVSPLTRLPAYVSPRSLRGPKTP